MTLFESMMLSVCFGAVMGCFIGNIIMLIKFILDDYREKMRRRVDETKTQEE